MKAGNMQAIQLDDYGAPDTLIFRELPSPVPGYRQVLLRVQATTLNPIELKLASGKMRNEMPLTFPWTPGADFSGSIVSLGEGVTDLAPGDEVYGFSSNGGAYAELILMDDEKVAKKPQSLTHVEAASVALIGQTALQAINVAELKAGQTILIHGASGSVGNAAVQLAHYRGARVIATGSASSAELIKSYGADLFVDYKTTPFESVAGNLDAVLDTVGGDTQTRSFPLLKENGCLVALTQPPSKETAERYHVRAIMLDTKSSRATLDEITKLLDSGALKPHIGKIYPLSDVIKAWQEWPSPQISGKIVFRVK